MTAHDQATCDLDQKSLEKLVDLVLDTTDPQEQVQFYGWVLSGRSHVQHKQALALWPRRVAATLKPPVSGCLARTSVRAAVVFSSKPAFGSTVN